MTVDPLLLLTAMVVGAIVGLTGMAGGTLLTPLLVAIFHVPPSAAIASDLVASALMKPFGAAVHLRSKTADFRVVGWLSAGSAPMALATPIVAHALFAGRIDEGVLRGILGAVVVVGSLLALLRTAMTMRAGSADSRQRPPGRVALAVLGMIAGMLVGLTSAGSGSVVAAGLMLLCPAMTGTRLTATDLVQAVPMVWAAALGHLVVGEFDLSVTVSVLLGGIPGVVIGSLYATKVRGAWLRTLVLGILMVSGLTMFKVPFAVSLAAGAAAGLVDWLLRAKSRKPQDRAADQLPSVRS